MRLTVATLMALILIGCSEEAVSPSEPVFVTWVLSPAGETFTVGIFNELGAGGGVGGSVVGTGNFEEVFFMRGEFDPSTQEVRGTFTGAYLVIGFGTRNGGWGAEAGSLQNLAGPGPQVSFCSVRYEANEPGGSTYSALFRFTTVPTSVCREP